MATLQEQLGALVKYHRGRAGLSQQELGEKIDRTSVQVSRIENGKSAPKFEALTAIAEALGVDVRDLFGVGDFAAREGRSDPLAEIVGELGELGPDELRNVADIVHAALRLRRTV